tara:strand:- start:312 stop:530 length:219 start_codon:yes stop_codon:yes gene_type:complete
MGRVKRDFRPKRPFNLMIYEDDLEKIYSLSVERTRELGFHVTKAAVIRKAISRFLKEIEKGGAEGEVRQSIT